MNGATGSGGVLWGVKGFNIDVRPVGPTMLERFWKERVRRISTLYEGRTGMGVMLLEEHPDARTPDDIQHGFMLKPVEHFLDRIDEKTTGTPLTTSGARAL